MRGFLWLVLCCLLCAPVPADEEAEGSGSNTMRVEQEDKLVVPDGQFEATWAFLKSRFVDDPAFLQQIDPALTSDFSQEEFWDQYYDTGSFELRDRQSSVRHRRRVNLSDANDRKSGRELMQIKVNSIDPKNPLARGEYKYDIEHYSQRKDRDDGHRFLGVVKRSHRAALKSQLRSLDLDAYDLRPILLVHDLRTRVYIKKNDEPYISISLDKVDVTCWWSTIRFAEIEPESNEIRYTNASEAERQEMDAVLKRLIEEIHQGCPWVQRDLTPKYNKSFDRLSQELPFFPFLAKAGLNNADGLLLFALALAAGLGGAIFLVIKLRRRRR